MKSSKGAQFERTICKKLSLWLSRGRVDDIFGRSRQSGGRATQRRKKSVKTTSGWGDVSADHPFGEKFLSTFCLELKRGYGGTKRVTDADIRESLRKGIKGIRNLLNRSKGKQTSVLDLLDAPEKNNLALLQHWEQCERDRDAGDRKFSMVIFKRDKRNPCVMMSREAAQWLIKKNNKPADEIQLSIQIERNDTGLVFLDLDEFLGWLNPRIFF